MEKTSQEQLVTPEADLVKRRVPIILGDHITDSKDLEIMNRKQEEGDLSSNIWGNDIRLALRKQNPHLLSIDSFPIIKEVGMDIAAKKEMLKLLPENPANLKLESIMVVGADPNYFWSKPLTEHLTYNSEIDSPHQKTALEKLTHLREQIEVSIPSSNVIDASSVGTAMLIGISVVAAATHMTQNDFKNIYEKERFEKSNSLKVDDRHTISRRKALFKFGSLLGLGTAVAMRPIFFPPRVEIERESGDLRIDKILKSIKKAPVNHDIVDGRSAILIQKGIEAGELMDEPNIAVVAGDAHGHNIEALLTDEKVRAEAIRKYAQTLLDVTDEVAVVAELNPEQKKIASMLILDSLCEASIYKINAFNHLVPPEMIDNEVKNAVEFIKPFRSIKTGLMLQPLYENIESFSSSKTVVTVK